MEVVAISTVLPEAVRTEAFRGRIPPESPVLHQLHAGLAVFSDVHGNALALDAILANIERAKVDRTVCLGDAVQGGAQPEAVVARLRELACPVVMGNTDAWLLGGEETGAEAPATPYMLAVRAWSLGRNTDTSPFAWRWAFRPSKATCP